MTLNEPVAIDSKILILRGTLLEVYYLLKDRQSKAIGDALFIIENVLPDVKNYELE